MIGAPRPGPADDAVLCVRPPAWYGQKLARLVDDQDGAVAVKYGQI